MWWSRRTVRAPVGAVWDLLVDLDAWPRWGPTVSSARLDDGGRTLTGGAHGAVRSPVGLWLPFEVTELTAPMAADPPAPPAVAGPGAGAVAGPAGPAGPAGATAGAMSTELVGHWSWTVAGVPATTHRVRPHVLGSVVELGAPWWAPAYRPVLEVATRRLAALAEAGD